MPRVLTEQQIETYRRDGFVAPIDLLTAAEAAALRRGIEDIEAGIEGEMQARFKIKAHLPFPFLCDVIANPRLLDAVEDIIGPAIRCPGPTGTPTAWRRSTGRGRPTRRCRNKKAKTVGPGEKSG